MKDLDNVVEQIEGISDKRLRLFGFRFTLAQLGVLLAAASSVIGTLYAGFTLYQKVESIAGLDLDAYQQAMDVMDAKVTGLVEKVDEAVEYSRDIKNGLRDDILRIEQQTDRVEDTVRDMENRVREMIDTAEQRFEDRREQLRTSQNADMAELESRLNERLQRALDNPLAN